MKGQHSYQHAVIDANLLRRVLLLLLHGVGGRLAGIGLVVRGGGIASSRVVVTGSPIRRRRWRRVRTGVGHGCAIARLSACVWHVVYGGWGGKGERGM